MCQFLKLAPNLSQILGCHFSSSKQQKPTRSLTNMDKDRAKVKSPKQELYHFLFHVWFCACQ